MAVDTILSKIEIQDTTVRHFRAIDENQVDDYLATWMPDGTLLLDEQTVQGHAALRRYFATFEEENCTRRLVTNFYIRIRTTQQATQRCYLMMIRPSPTPVLTAFAVCEDQLIREDEGWKFSQRIIRLSGAGSSTS